MIMIPTNIAERLLYAQRIFRDKTLSEKEKREILFLTQPDTREDIQELWASSDISNKWEVWREWLDTDEGSDSLKLIDNAKYHLPPNVILNKYQMIMDAYRLDIGAVTQLEKRIYEDEYGNIFFCAPARARWDVIRDYMDEFIKLPDVPNVQYNLCSDNPDVPQIDGAYSEERTEKFLRALRERGYDYIIQFMLFVMLRPDGSLTEYLKSSQADWNFHWEEDTYNYTRPSQIRDFPGWYQSWDKLVPTMCQRYEALQNPVSCTPNWPQQACGSLIYAPKYRLTAKEVEQYKSAHPEDFDNYMQCNYKQ